MPFWNNPGFFASMARLPRAILPLVPPQPTPTGAIFDAGFAPVPQDVNFDNWTNSGWPRGPVPRTPTDGVEIADFRQYVQMYVGAVGAEPIYYDHPAAVNGSLSGLVEIRLAAGPGDWQGAGGSVTTTYGRWTVNANDGLHLSYRPKPRATGPGANDVDTEAQYRWTPDGVSWSDVGTLKMTLVKPPSAVLFIDDFGVTFNNLSANNVTALNSAISAAVAANATLTQRNGANWAIWNELSRNLTNTIHLYALKIRRDVPSTGNPPVGKAFSRVFSIGLADVPHDPFQLLFLDFNGRSGVQLAEGLTTVWDHFSGADPEHHHFWHFGSSDAVSGSEVTPTHRPTTRIKYSMFYNSPTTPIHQWHNADMRSQYCDHIGVFRGMHTNSGSNGIWHVQDCRGCDLLNNEGGFKNITRVYAEPERGHGSAVYRVERVLVDQNLTMNTHLEFVRGWHAGSDLQINDLWMNPEYGAQIFIGPAMRLTRCHLVTTWFGYPFFNLGSSLPGGQRILTDCDVIINNKPMVRSAALVARPSTDHLAAGIHWNVGADAGIWDAAGAYGWTDRVVNTTIRIGEGLASHTGQISGFRVFSTQTDVAKQAFLRLENVTFIEAIDKQFTHAVEGHSTAPDLVVYYDEATAANNAGLITAGRMWGPNTIPTPL